MDVDHPHGVDPDPCVEAVETLGKHLADAVFDPLTGGGQELRGLPARYWRAAASA